MARSALVLDLAKAATSANTERIRLSVKALVSEAKAKKHHKFASQLENLLNHSRSFSHIGRPGSGASRLGEQQSAGVRLVAPERFLRDLILPTGMADVVQGLVLEHQRKDRLRERGLEPRHRVLLVGPPGNGKTSLAEVLAGELDVPLLVASYEGIVSSWLGQTAQKLEDVFRQAHRNSPCVLFFDEVDVLGASRSSPQEVGEIKRLVGSLLLQIDALPSDIVVVFATNHPELLDRGVWRRFQVRLELPRPNLQAIATWLSWYDHFHAYSGGGGSGPLTDRCVEISQTLLGCSFAEVCDFGESVKRSTFLDSDNTDPNAILDSCLNEWRIQRWKPSAPNGVWR